MNIFLVKFYNDVKSPSWPEIETYGDYQKLPLYIKQECEQQHNLFKRFSEIEDPDYWRKLTLEVWVKDNLGYVPVLKCAYSYYSKQFQDLGWKKTNIGSIDKETVLFGVIKDPLTRWIKGVVEFLSQVVQVNNVTDEFLERLLCANSAIAMPDLHSVCYHIQYGNYLNNITWIPMDDLDDQQIKTCLQTFCKKHGQSVDFADQHRINPSSELEKNLYNKIRKLLYEHIDKNSPYIINLQIFMAPDLKFYRNLISNFDPSFSNLNK